MSAGFSISCPGLERVVQRMEDVDLREVYDEAATPTAEAVSDILYARAMRARAPQAVVDAIGVSTDVETGEVQVGVLGEQGPAAYDDEYGTPTSNPGGWHRAVMTSYEDDFADRFAGRLSAGLQRRLVRG